jgi:hypothetical protein
VGPRAVLDAVVKKKIPSPRRECHSVQKRLSSRLLYKNLKIKIRKTVILPVVLYGCEEHRLKVSENRLMRIFGPKSKK